MMLNRLKTHKRWLIPTGVAALLISLLFAFTLHLQHRRQGDQDAPAPGKADKGGLQGTPRQIPGLPAGMLPEDRLSAFSGEPAPAELLRKLEALDSYQRKTEEMKLADLQLIWPLYFFSSTRTGEDTVSVLLDASEYGFGVIIKTEISLKEYPGMASARPGDRIWLGGKIAAIDTHGTGQINFITEYVGFNGQKDGKPGTGITDPK